MTLYRDPVKITPYATDHERSCLFIVDPDGRQFLIYDGETREAMDRAAVLRAAIRQALFETLRGLTEQIR
jgi:hypothetical protein